MAEFDGQSRDRRNPGAIDYFHRRIYDFDSIYETDMPGLKGWLNKTLRASVRRRFDLAFELLGDMTGKSVLDIGCGSGRFMFESVSRGAGEVIGLDDAAGALDAAGKIAGKLGVDGKMQFVKTDFLDYTIPHKFNVVFAVGYFDYILAPLPHLEKMLASCDGFLFASFPKLWHPMTPVRKMRLAVNGCPVRFYSKEKIEQLMSRAGYSNFEIISVARDYILVARL